MRKIKKDNAFFLEGTIRDTRLETKYKRTVIDNVAYKKIDQEEFLALSISTKKINIFLILISFIAIIIFGRLFYLQIYRGDYYRNRSEGNRIRVQNVPAARGLIYDSKDNLLVKNIPDFTLTVTLGDLPNKIEDKQVIYEKLSNIVKISKAEIENKLDGASFWTETEIANNLTYDQAMELMIIASELPGVECRALATREYIEPEALSHLVGYLGKISEKELEEEPDDYAMTDYIGKSGLESQYENVLKGEKGKKQVEVDSSGNEIKTIANQDAVAGDNLILSLDLDLQKNVYEAIEKYALAKHSSGGAVVAMDPRNGEILAFVSWPGFNTNEFVKGIDYESYQKLLTDEAKPLFNKVISGEYPSGSTFKLVVAAAALQEGEVSLNTTVNSTGGVQVNKWFFPDWKDGGHGQTDIHKALAESVNTYFYIAGGGTFNEETNEIEGGLGINKINKYAKLFGLSNYTNIDLEGEKQGFLPTKEWKKEYKGDEWYIGDTYNTAIGQGDVLVTPLQVANFTAAIANGGSLLKPRIVSKINNYKNELQQEMPVEILNSNFVNSNYIDIVKQGMRDAVTYGSAKSLNNLPVAVAAKTGTAQHGGEGDNHSWLTAFAPYDNPEIVITVLVEEGGEGTESALPVVSEALNYYFKN